MKYSQVDKALEFLFSDGVESITVQTYYHRDIKLVQRYILEKFTWTELKVFPQNKIWIKDKFISFEAVSGKLAGVGIKGPIFYIERKEYDPIYKDGVFIC